MTRIAHEVCILRQCSSIDLHTGSLPFLKPCRYFFVAHVHAELVCFGVNSDNITVCPFRTVPHIRTSERVQSETVPTERQEGVDMCSCMNSEVHGKHTPEGVHTP